MENLTDAAALRKLLTRHGIRLEKGLGQHFLVNPAVCPRMAQECGAGKQDGVIEIGSGAGTLTRELCRCAGKVVGVELDRRLSAVLAETVADCPNFTLVEGDAMKLDFAALIQKEFPGRNVVICANLPYYLTSPLIMRWLESRLPVKSITVMVQKEAAQRICAPEGSRESGAVTLAVRYYAETEKLFEVSRGSFLPPPKVDSAVIRLTPRFPPEAPGMFALIRAAFSRRRKTLANSLTQANLHKDEIIAACERCGISPDARAEQLTLNDYAALTEALGR